MFNLVIHIKFILKSRMVLKSQAEREYECRCIVDKMNENRSFMIDDDIRIVFEQMRRYIHEKKICTLGTQDKSSVESGFPCPCRIRVLLYTYNRAARFKM